MFLTADTFDDLLRLVLKEICSHGRSIEPKKGKASEVFGVLLELRNPRARLSRTESRGKIFSGLGELCWYLAGTNSLAFIEYYAKEYAKYADGDVVYGGYGPRIFGAAQNNQVHRVLSLLREHSVTRQAVIQIFDRVDLLEEHKDVPCTCTLQFAIRDECLHLLTNMRSNDWFLGLPHDVFAFTMLQEMLARALDIELGTYKHCVGSLHLYEVNEQAAQDFLSEGWQSTESPMPPMPAGDPWKGIDQLRRAEEKLRLNSALTELDFDGVDPYWADLIRLLLVFHCKKNSDVHTMRQARKDMVSKIYDPFIEKIAVEMGS
ncbi:MAG TPA: thymidylate synthase [Terriglobales bacterium]|nr:thymidylate synthase [Terriglobales bacterium]